MCDARVKNQPRGLVTAGEIHALGIDPAGPPATLRRAADRLGIERQRLGMVGVHMREGAVLGLRQRRRIGNVKQQLRPLIGGGLGEAAVEMAARDVHPPEGKVAKIGVERRFGMTREEATARLRPFVAVEPDGDA